MDTSGNFQEGKRRKMGNRLKIAISLIDNFSNFLFFSSLSPVCHLLLHALPIQSKGIQGEVRKEEGEDTGP